MISVIIPTRNRHDELRRTLAQLAALPWESAPEVIVIDNASEPPVQRDGQWTAQVIRLERNLGAAARNVGASAASYPWLLMLDDDSAPLDLGFESVIHRAPSDALAIGAEILLPTSRHEAGGLPEVPVGCGVLIRRDAFLEVGGYDESFGYYAEEYDLAAKVLLAGGRVMHDGRFRVLHRKLGTGRSFDQIIARLVRNNGWVRARYAPDRIRDREIKAEIDRYRRIAAVEKVKGGFERGLRRLRESIDAQPRREMSPGLYQRLTGEAAACHWLAARFEEFGAQSTSLTHPGKGDGLIKRLVNELGLRLVDDDAQADVRVVATLAPGPMLDGLDQEADSGPPVLGAWWFPNATGGVAIGVNPAMAE